MTAELEQLGRYEIESEIGRGAMGIVYKAHDPMLERPIALKTLTASVGDDPGMLDRFRREAKAAGALQHANIVTIYEMGEADGVPFIAMEYLEGETLEALIRRRARIPLAQKIGYLVDTCRALQYAHRRGVIHRDIKPANILVTTDGVVKVVDFGIARIAGTSKTQTGTVLGTLAYMSPQQIRGERPDARSDIWSLGVVLYELLAYRRPFLGENHAALLLSILQTEPTPLRDLVRECPRQLDVISQRTLAKDETARYQSMEQLLLELKSAWAALHLAKPGQLPGEAAHPAERHYGARPTASQKTQVLPSGRGPALNLPAGRSAETPKGRSIPVAAVTAAVMAPQPSPATASNISLLRSLKVPWWRLGGAFAGIALIVLAGIALKAHRVRLHGPDTPPPATASSESRPALIAPEPNPAAQKPVEATAAIDNGPRAEARFDAAQAHFRQAVAAKDAASLKSQVWLEFQQIAQEGGPRAKDAERYISTAIPTALRNMTPWPRIGCGVGLPDRDADVQSGSFVACGVLDAPKLQWVQFSWPEFPERARQAGLANGVAMLTLTVNQEGNIARARSRVPPDAFGFAAAAIQAATKWKTSVPLAGGKAVRTQFSVDIPFSR
jgi:eukaryotic-like serine/threonine-protein kinase